MLIDKLFLKPASFGLILRCTRWITAHLTLSKLRRSQLVRLVLNQNTWFQKEFIKDESLKNILTNENAFDVVDQWEGEIYRQLKSRVTLKINFNNKNYFLKKHYGVGWKEIIKNLFTLKLPIINAYPEWQALQKLQAINIKAPKPIAFSRQGFNPAKQKSFIIMKAIENHISLETLFHSKFIHPLFKHALINKIAEITARMHQHGINHRDLYLCHFFIDQNPNFSQPPQQPIELYLIDLHRAQIRNKVPTRWRIKDLSALYFSSLEYNFSPQDYARFIKRYMNTSKLNDLKANKNFWKKIYSRAIKLKGKLAGRNPDVARDKG